MANSNGIDYFSFNVDFFDDDKLALIEGEFGLKGSYIAIRLLCKIYKEGYYYQWGDDECLLFARKVGADIVPNLVKEVVYGLVKRSFFDKGVFDRFKILTSHGIQIRYFDAVKRRQCVEVRSEFLLIDVSKYPNVRILNENVNIENKNEYISQQSKLNQSKGNENRVKETPPQTPPHGVISSSEAELFSNSFFPTRNIDSLMMALSSMGTTNTDKIELARLSNDGEKDSPIWELLENMKNSGGRISMTETVQCMQMYERQNIIRCKSRLRMKIEIELRSMVKSEELSDIIAELINALREERCQQAIADVKNSGGRIKMPAKYILSELRKIR